MNKEERIKKYNYLETEFFGSGVSYTYEFIFDKREYTLDFENDGKYYLYTDNKAEDKGPFDDIYKALDGIILGGKTLRQLLLDTDFNFEKIS